MLDPKHFVGYVALENGDNCIVAHHYDLNFNTDKNVYALFGTCCLPTPYTNGFDMKKALQLIQNNNPDRLVCTINELNALETIAYRLQSLQASKIIF